MILNNDINTPAFVQKKLYRTPNFTGTLDGVVTGALRTLDTNPMANAVGIDLFAMVAPRTGVFGQFA